MPPSEIQFFAQCAAATGCVFGTKLALLLAATSDSNQVGAGPVEGGGHGQGQAHWEGWCVCVWGGGGYRAAALMPVLPTG